MPERPGRPDIELASDTELFMTWEAPVTVGGVEVLAYRLEYRRAGGTNAVFFILLTVV